MKPAIIILIILFVIILLSGSALAFVYLNQSSWGPWSEWSACDKNCGGGLRSRVRECINPPCEGDAEEIEACNTHDCPVVPINGGWTNWSNWSNCSKECGGGSQTRTRSCTNPPPQNGGASCVGDATETQSCNTQECAVDGGWSFWYDWSECSKSCGGGTQTRIRKCNNPSPTAGGADCVGSDSETRSCNTHQCDIDGGWGSWSEWSTCTKECDGGTYFRSRICNNPTPQGGGAQCVGENVEVAPCNTQQCPILPIPANLDTGIYYLAADNGAKRCTSDGGGGIWCSSFSDPRGNSFQITNNGNNTYKIAFIPQFGNPLTCGIQGSVYWTCVGQNQNFTITDMRDGSYEISLEGYGRCSPGSSNLYPSRCQGGGGRFWISRA